jgi:c-di-GMP-binding flagellar brake protein YcgR
MGALSQPRKNPFVAHGLVPGVTLRLEVSVRDHVESYVTRVEAVDAERISVLVPMARLQLRPLSAGTVVHATYDYRKKRWSFISEVIGHSVDSTLEYLQSPITIESRERRTSFRLETALRPRSLYRLVVDMETVSGDDAAEIEATVVDLSEGGICLSSRSAFRSGERLGIQLELPRLGRIHARMRVISIDEPRASQLNRRVHCIFTEIGLSDRDRVARYLMHRQLEMRRRGQL